MSTSRVPVFSDKAPKPASFLSQAIVDGNRVFCSGQVGLDPQDGKMVQGTVQDRTTFVDFSNNPFNQAQVLKNLGAVLESAGSSLSRVIKVNIYLTDLGDFTAMNEVYETFFENPRPVSNSIASEQ
ncbi:hypothetical protein SLS56_011236 [Neofusicoccum ribis]|uniref:Uncharacterized protein n=1 Tax=Neofusicoccum ribis TaxID=45134 RepID=A0ABR3SC87_9PEZI